MFANSDDFKSYLSRTFGATGDLERFAQLSLQRNELVNLSQSAHLLVLTMKMVLDHEYMDAAQNIDLVCKTLAEVSQELRSSPSKHYKA